MKVFILLALLAVAVSFPFLGKCSWAPKYRPLYCFYGQVWEEDLPELMALLYKYRRGGDDEEFADYLGDMYDKKEFREPKISNEEERIKLGRCAQPYIYRSFGCYAESILRRDRKQLKAAYDSLFISNNEEFVNIYYSLVAKKRKYFGTKNEN